MSPELPFTVGPLSVWLISFYLAGSNRMDNNLNAAYDACNSFNNKLRDTIMGLINANTERKKEIDGLRADHDKLRQDHNSFESSATRENDLR